MAYEVYPYSWPVKQYIFETFEEIVDHYWYEFYSGRAREFRIINTYDRQPVRAMDHLYSIFYKKRDAQARRWWERSDRKYEFRNGPVPGTGVRRRHRGSYYRYQRTFAETREEAWIEHDEDMSEYGIRGRPKRSSLPDPWDDYCRSDIYDRSWKKHRKTQWKA